MRRWRGSGCYGSSSPTRSRETAEYERSLRVLAAHLSEDELAAMEASNALRPDGDKRLGDVIGAAVTISTLSRRPEDVHCGFRIAPEAYSRAVGPDSHYLGHGR